MKWIEQRHFILNNTQKLGIKRNISTAPVRSKTFSYFLKNEEGTSFQVCKPFFLTTLGFKPSNDRVVQNILGPSINNVVPKPDMRGKKSAATKIDRYKIIDHVQSFHPSISHYRREHAPKRKYLPSDVSITFMHKDFKGKYKEQQCSYDLYRSVVKEMNISFTKLGNEECEECAIFGQHEHTKDSLEPDCDKCIQYGSHIGRAKKSRKMYREDASVTRNVGDVCYSVDLQTVVMLPMMEQFKRVLFTPRIVLFNESFVPMGKQQLGLKPFAAIWQEGIAGRKKEDILSSFNAFFLSNREANKITIWLDNCSAQNKSWCFLTYLIYIINSSKINANEIYVKYFEPGHTFMSADHFHHQVDQSMKFKGNLFDFNDFKQAVQEANSGKVNVHEVKVEDFFDWVDHCSQAKIKKTIPRPYLNNIVKVVATRGKNTLQYWTDFDSEPAELNFLNAKIMKTGVKCPPVPRHCCRGIPMEKKHGILQKLCPLVPSNRVEFWQSLLENDVQDLNDVYDA